MIFDAIGPHAERLRRPSPWIRGCAASLLFCCGTLAAQATQEPKFIRFSVTDAWSQPFGEFDHETLVSGIMKDLITELAVEADLPPRFIRIPRKRVDEAVEMMQIDARCYINPAWVKDPSLYVWSGPLFRMQEFIVHRSDAPPLTDFQSLKGKTVGVILGYQKYDFDTLIQSGEVQTVIAPSGDHLIRMLINNRIQYAAINSIVYAYHLKKSEFAQVMGSSPLTTSESAVQCAFPKNAQVPPHRLKSAADSLRDSGKIEKILAKYR